MVIAWLGGRPDPVVAAALSRSGHLVRTPDADGLVGCDAVVIWGADRSAAALDVGTLLRRVATAGVPRVIYLADLSYDMDAAEGVVSPAGLAQAEVQVAALDWTVLRVGPLFGGGEHPVGALAALAARLPLLPLPADGGARLQPLAADDLGDLVNRTLATSLTVGGVYDVAGPECFRLSELVERIAWVSNRRAAVCHLPAPLVRALASLLQRLGWAGAAWLACPGDLVPGHNQAEALLGRAPVSFTRTPHVARS